MKGSIIILPHPPEVINVDPEILAKMKQTLKESPSQKEVESLVDRA